MLEKACNRADQSSTACGYNDIIEVDLFVLLKHLFGHCGISSYDRIVFEGMDEFNLSVFSKLASLLDTFFVIGSDLVDLYELFSFLLDEVEFMFKATLREEDVEFD